MKTVFTSFFIFCSIFLNAQTWVQEASPPSPVGLDGPMWFSIGGKLYVGGGYNGSSGCQTGFYEYNPRTNTWTTKAPIPIGLASYGFVINGKGYTVCGITANGTIVPNVYMYDPVLDQWTRKRDFTEGTMRQNHTCFSLNGYGYMFGGFIGGSPPNNVLEEMWQYNPTLDTFIKMTSCPGPPGRNGPAAVVINNQAYVGMGCTSNAGTFYRDFYLFDPVSNTYTPKDSIPTGRSSVANFTWGGKGYIGLGLGPGPIYLNDFWIYDPVANTWTADNNYGGGVRAHPFSDTVAGLPYVGCGNTSTTFTLDNWRWGCILPVYVGHDTTLCAGTSISLRDTFSRDISLHATYLWSTGDTTPAITVSTAGSYWLQVTIDSCSGRDTINVSYLNPPAAFSLGNDTTYNGNFTRILSTGSPTTRWSTGVTGSSITVNVFGTYWAVDSNQCGIVRDTIILSPLRTWLQKASLPTDSIGLYSYSFSIGGKLYVGGGYYNGTICRSFYQYDPATNVWTRKANIPIPVYGGAFFVINGMGYVVSGTTLGFVSTPNVYMYNPGNDTWTQKNPFGGSARQNTIGFSLNGYGYVYCGFNGSVLNDMWEYNPTTDSWTQKANPLGPARNSPTAIVINNIPYVGLGSNSNASSMYSDFYSFNPGAIGVPGSGSYTQVANSPVFRSSPAHFTVGSVGYIGLGATSATAVTSDFALYDPLSNTWTQVCYFGGTARGWTFSDTINGQPYVGAGANLNSSIFYSDLWTWGVCPLAVNLGRDTAICTGSTITLRDTFANAKSLWSTGDTTSSITVSSAGTYWLQVTQPGPCGCVGRDTINVTFASPPAAFSLGNDTNYCSNFTRNLSISQPGQSYRWSTGATTPSISVSTATLYWGQDSNICGVKRDTIILSQNAAPLAFSLGNDTNYCANFSRTLSISQAGLSYRWSTGATTASISVSTGVLYWGQDSNICGVARDTIVLSQNAAPLAFSLGNDTTYCANFTRTLSINAAGVSYRWSSGATSSSISVSGPSLYWGQDSNICGVSRDTIVLSQSTAPASFSLGADTTYCANFTSSLSINVAGVNYRWSTGATTSSISVSTANLYWGQDSNICGVKRDTIVLSQNAAPLSFSLGNDTTYCANFTRTLSISQSGLGYRWSTGEITSSIIVSAGTLYWGQDSNICGVKRDTIQLSQNAAPLAFSLGNDTNYCANFTRTLSISQTGLGYRWSTGAITPSISVSAGVLYWGQDSNICGVKRDTIQLSQNAAPLAFSLGNDTNYCANFTRTLSISQTGQNYRWSTGLTTQTISVSTAGVYWGQDSNICGVKRDTIQLSQNAAPLAFSLGNDTNYCANFTRTLSISQTGQNYRWNTGLTTQTISVSTAGVYWGQDSNICGIKRDTIQLYQNATPLAFSLGNDTTYCDNFNRTLSIGQANQNYRWSNGFTTQSISVSTAGIYWGQDSNICGVKRDTIQLSQNAAPLSFSLGNDTTYCANFTRNLSISQAGQSYRWNTGATTASISVSTANLYWGQDSNICGVKRDTIVLSQNAAPLAFSLGNDTTYCANFTRSLSISQAGQNYRWSTGATTSSISVSTANLYWGQDSNICGVKRDTIQLYQNAAPLPISLGNDTNYCANFTRSLSISQSGQNYRWSTGLTAQTILVSTAGIYWGQDSNICGVSRDTISLSQNAAPLAFSLGNDTNYCSNFTRTLSINQSGQSYKWSTGDITHSISVSTAGIYWGQDSNICGVKRDTIQLYQNAAPLTFSLGNDTNYCTNFTRTLSISQTGQSYRWSTGEITPSITISAAGVYWGQDSNICGIATDTIYLTQDAAPLAFTLGSDTAYCDNFTRNLSISQAGLNYRWSTGLTTSSISVSTAGLYWGQDSNICGVKRDTIVLIENITPLVYLGHDTTLCVGSTLSLVDTSTNATFLWNTNATTSSLNVTTTGTYWLEVTQQNCTARDTIVATFVSPTTTFSLGHDTIYCSNFSRTLTISIPGVDYRWSTGATTESITVSAPGIYWGQDSLYWLPDSSICNVFRDTIVVIQNTPPIVQLGNDTTLCIGSTLILNDTSTNATFLWSTSATSSSINVTSGGTYWLQATQNNCPASDTIVVAFQSPLANFSLGNDTTYCANFTHGLSISATNVSYRWSTGETTSSISVSAPGLYWGQDSNACGTMRDTIILSQYAPPVVNLGQDTILCTSTSIQLSDTSTNAAFLWSTGATGSSLNVTSSGTYWLQVTQNTCVGRDTIVIAPIGPPSGFNLGNDTTYCANFSRILSIGVAGVNYRWNTGAVTPSIPVSVAGLYWGQDSNICGTKRDTIILDQYTPPVVNLGQDTILCTSTSILLNDTSTNAAFLWSTGATTSSLNVTTSGTYWLRVTQNTCVGRDTIVIAPISPPSSFNLGNDTTYCAGFSRTLSIGVAGVNYRWNTGATTSSIPVSVAGLYWGQDSNICGTKRDTIILSQYAPPVVNLGQDTILCTNTSILLSDTSTNAAFLWSTGATTSSLNVTSSGTYWLQVTQNTCVGRDTIVITPISPPSGFNLGNDTTYCANFSRTLSIGVAGVNYRWNTGAVTPSIPVSVAGLYWGQDSNICGTNRDTIILSQYAPPVVNLGQDTILCTSTSILLNDTSTNAAFLWSTGATTSSLNVTTSGTYWLKVTQNTCVGRDTIVIAPISPPSSFNLGNDTTYCASFSRTLSIGVAGVNYRWNTGAVTPTIPVSVAGLYWGQDSNICGTKRDTIILNQYAPPVVRLGNDTTLCVGSTLVLNDTTTNATFLWSTSATASSINVTTSGTYWLQVTQNSCPARDTIVATFQNPSANFSLGNDTIYCANFTRILSISVPNVSHRWSTGDTISSISVSSPGLYWGQDSDLCGVKRDTIILNQNTPPIVHLGNDTTLCAGTILVLSDTSSNATFLWSTNATTSSINVTTTGTYWLKVTQSNCPVRDTIVATFVSPPTTFSVGHDTTYCNNFIRTLSTGRSTTQWNNGVTGSTITVNAPGVYWAIDSNLCGKFSDTITLNQSTLPALPNIGNDTAYCTSFTRALSIGVANVGYRWSTGATTAGIIVSVPGLYWGQDSNICGVKRDTVILTQNTPPVVNLGNDTTLCVGSTLVLNDTSTNANFLWNTNATTSSINVTTSGTYWLQVTQSNCPAADTILVTFQSPPTAFSLGNDTIYCSNFTHSLSIAVPNVGYRWSTGATTSGIIVSVPGLYWGEDSNQCGTYRDTIRLTQNTPPAVDLGNDTTVCSGITVNLNAGNSGATFRWQDQSSAQNYTVTDSGLYWVNVTAGGCSTTDSILVSYILPPSAFSLGNDKSACEDSGVVLNAFQPNATFYIWNTFDTTPSITVNQAGIYYVTDSNECGSATASVVVALKRCNCILAIPSGFSPNNDGKNDKFGVFNYCAMDFFVMEIYNRWGQNVFTAVDPESKWDGTYMGSPAPMGVYTYKIYYYDLSLQTEKVVLGNVTLLR